MITFKVAVQRDTFDRYGDVSGSAEHEVKGCIDWPTNTSSVPGAAITTTTTRTLVAPFGADIIDGADPATTPVQTQESLQLVVNPDAAERMGTTLPATVVAEAAVTY